MAKGTHEATAPLHPPALSTGPILHAAVVALPYIGVVATVLAVGLPTLILPFWPDQAIFSLIGKTIAHGGFPYVDAWDQKPPSIYVIYAVAIHGPFDLMQNVRAFDLAWTVATVLVVCALGRRWWNVRAGVIAGLGYGVVYLTGSGWARMAQPDSFIGLPLALALLCFERGRPVRTHLTPSLALTGGRHPFPNPLRSGAAPPLPPNYDAARGRRGFLIAAGVLLGFAFQLRFIMVLLIPVIPLVELATAPPRDRIRLWLRRMGWLGAGFIAFQMVVAVYLLAGGALGAYLDATRWAAGYTRADWPWPIGDGPSLGAYLTSVRFGFWDWARERSILTAPAVIGGVIGAFVLHERRVQQLVLFAVLAYAGIAVQAKFFPYHYTYMLLFVALLAGWAWDRCFSVVERAQPRPVARLMCCFLVAVLLLYSPAVLDSGWRQWRSSLAFSFQPETRETFHGSFEGFRDARDVAAYLRRRTGPGDSLYVWGFDPLIYLLADRPNASRFIYTYAVMSAWAPHAWQSTLMQDLQAHPPAYFAVLRAESGLGSTGQGLGAIDDGAYFPAFRTWLMGNYEFEADLNSYVVFRRSVREQDATP